MCNDYRMNKSLGVLAVDTGSHLKIQLNFSAEVFPGRTGVVIAQNELRAMTWGFPRKNISKRTGLPLKPSPVNNARDDRLLDKRWPWRESFEQRRCLIPVTQWAEAQGEKGRMTKTWYRPAGQELFCCAGIWRPTDEWGDAYSMIMVDASAEMLEVHDRMPVILRREDWATFTDGSPADAFELVKTWHGPLDMDATDEKWGSEAPPDPLLF